MINLSKENNLSEKFHVNLLNFNLTIYFDITEWAKKKKNNLLQKIPYFSKYFTELSRVSWQ